MATAPKSTSALGDAGPASASPHAEMEADNGSSSSASSARSSQREQLRPSNVPVLPIASMGKQDPESETPPRHDRGLRPDAPGGIAADAIPSCAYAVQASHRRNVVILSVSFLGIFSGFQAAQGLQTSVNGTLGSINLGVLYITFSLLCVVSPPLLSSLERGLGLRLVMLFAGLPYVAMIISNVATTTSDFSAMWALPIAMNFLVGVGAPLLWTSQNVYIARVANAAALDLRATAPRAAGDELSQMTTQFNSLFFAIYQFSGLIGNLLASGMLLGLGSGETVKRTLFCILGVVTTCGALLFVLLPPVAGEENCRSPSLTDVLHLAFTDKKMGLLIPIIFTNGMTLAFFFGDFQSDVTCPALGAGWTGFILATFFFTNSMATSGWGRTIERQCTSRRFAYVAATLCIFAFMAVKILWPVPKNFEKDSSSGDWTPIAGKATSYEYAIVFALTALFACGDAFWEAGPTMTLQTFYAQSEEGGPDYLTPAMANYKLWQSLGFAVQFFLGAVLSKEPQLRGLILLFLVVISLLCVLILNARVARLDARSESNIGHNGQARECTAGDARRPLVLAPAQASSNQEA